MRPRLSDNTRILFAFKSSMSSSTPVLAGVVDFPWDEGLIEAASTSEGSIGHILITSGESDFDATRVWDPWKAKRSVALHTSVVRLASCKVVNYSRTSFFASPPACYRGAVEF